MSGDIIDLFPENDNSITVDMLELLLEKAKAGEITAISGIIEVEGDVGMFHGDIVEDKLKAATILLEIADNYRKEVTGDE